MFSQVGKLDQNRNGDRIIHFYLFYNQLRQKGLIQEGFSLLRFFLNDQFLDLIMEIIKEELSTTLGLVGLNAVSYTHLTLPTNREV